MMKWLEKLGFQKADEMDQHIHTTALRASWLVIVVCLLGWGVYGGSRWERSMFPCWCFPWAWQCITG